VAALSYFIIKEKTPASELINMFVCFAVLCADVIYTSETETEKNGIYTTLWGVALTFLSLAMFSGTYIINRHLRE
jgi:hypothetical protein